MQASFKLAPESNSLTNGDLTCTLGLTVLFKSFKLSRETTIDIGWTYLGSAYRTRALIGLVDESTDGLMGSSVASYKNNIKIQKAKKETKK